MKKAFFVRLTETERSELDALVAVSCPTVPVYRPCQPRASFLDRLIKRYVPEFQRTGDQRYARRLRIMVADHRPGRRQVPPLRRPALRLRLYVRDLTAACLFVMGKL